MISKTCIKCNINKSLNDFCKAKVNKDGYAGTCKLCKKEYNVLNKDKISLSNKKYKLANPNSGKITTAEWRRNNPSKLVEYSDRWRNKNRNKYNAISASRKKRLRNATPKWVSKEELDKIRMLYTISGWITNNVGIEMHVDHVIPLQGKNVSGFHCLSNLQVIPAIDNLKKSNSFKAA